MDTMAHEAPATSLLAFRYRCSKWPCAALVDKDAELLGQWGLLMEWIKKAGGLPRHLEVAQ